MQNTIETNRNRFTLILVFAVPVVVLLASTLLYFLADARVVELGEANRGTLIAPPVQLAELNLVDANGQALDYSQPEPRWSYMVFGGASCDNLCERALFVIGQTHKLLGKKTNRVQQFYVSTERAIEPALRALMDQQHPDLRLAYGAPETIMEQLAAPGLDPLSEQVFFLVDPRGWVMMYYSVGDSSQETLSLLSKDMIKDVKRLIP